MFVRSLHVICSGAMITIARQSSGSGHRGQLIIFEVQLAVTFVKWKSAKVLILRDVYKIPPDRPQPHYIFLPPP